MFGTLVIAIVIAGLALWLVRPRSATRRTAIAQQHYAVVTGHIVRHARASGDAIFGLRCSACGPIGEAVGQRGAERTSTEHLRLSHSERR